MERELVKISVRELVEFILRSGDLDNRTGGKKDAESMLAGARIHRKIQKSMVSQRPLTRHRSDISLKQYLRRAM